ncbi:MAG: hypothetical protein HKP09_01270, partial [Enterobacterales bacterium]|nr:hypothetical protein [Enterobacterales bacterium]
MRVWRKAANALLMLNQHITITISFMLIIVFGTFWIVLEKQLEEHLFSNARNYGYGVAQYASQDLLQLINDNDSEGQTEYLIRLTNSPLVVSAFLYDAQGKLLAEYVENSDSPPDDNQLITLLQDIYTGTTRSGIIKITLNRKQQEAPVKKFMNGLAFLAVFMMVMASVAVYFIARLLVKPVNRLFSLPLEAPNKNQVETMDVAEELQTILEKSGRLNNAPAPLSDMESAGIHKLLAVESSAMQLELVIMTLHLHDFKSWVDSHTKPAVVKKLREIDQRVLVAVHGQSGIVVQFNGISATACFGMSEEDDNPDYKAFNCAHILMELLVEIGIDVSIHIYREQRIVLKHRHRSSVAMPMETFEDPQPNKNHKILLHDNV